MFELSLNEVLPLRLAPKEASGNTQLRCWRLRRCPLFLWTRCHLEPWLLELGAPERQTFLNIIMFHRLQACVSTERFCAVSWLL